MNIAPARGSRIVLAAIPFFLILMVYIIGSAERRAANPDDKLLPPISEMADTTKRLATEPDRRSGDYVLWTDTAASLPSVCSRTCSSPRSTGTPSTSWARTQPAPTIAARTTGS